MTWEDTVRSDFPILHTHKDPSLIYLDSAATTHKPRQVIDALANFYQNEYATVHRTLYRLSTQATEKYNQVRRQVETWIGAKEGEVVFTRGTTESINLVAHSFGSLLSEGDVIILSEMEHHSNIVAWQLLAERKKIELRYVRITPKAELDLAHFEQLLSPAVKLVSIAHIANTTGTIHPIETIIQKAHAYGAKVLIDAAQTPAHLPMDVASLDADFLAFSGHKMYGPTGVGILYGKKELLQQMPPLYGGGDMIAKVSLDAKTTYQDPPLRFEAGTPMIAQVIGLGAAITYLSEIGLDTIHAHEEKLLDYALQELPKISGLTVIGEPKARSSIISFLIDNTHPLDVATLLDLEGIAVRSGHLCAQPFMKHLGVDGILRVSFALFNTEQEIDHLVKALRRITQIL